MDGSPCRWLAHKRKRSLPPRLDGRDPAEEKKQSRRRLVVDRIDDLIEAFIHEHISQTVSRNRISNLLRRDVIPHWGAKSIHEIKKRYVSDLIGLGCVDKLNPDSDAGKQHEGGEALHQLVVAG